MNERIVCLYEQLPAAARLIYGDLVKLLADIQRVENGVELDAEALGMWRGLAQVIQNYISLYNEQHRPA